MSSYFNYFYIAIAILWKPLQGTIISFDGKGRILLILTIVSIIANCNKKAFRNLLFSKPIALWFTWCIFATVNTYINGYDDPVIPFYFFAVNQVFCPCIIMAVSAFEYQRNPHRFLIVALCTYLIYSFIGAFVMDIGYVAQEEGASSVNTLGNSLSLNVMMIIFFAGVLYCRKEIKLTTVTALILYAICIIIVSATRKALGAGVIMIIALILSHFKWSFGNFIKFLFPMILLYASMNFVMSNTQMGERFQEMEETSDKYNEQYDIKGNIFLEIVGDRAPQYIMGAQIFKENPITGIGLRNFQRVSGYPFRLHTEYMVQICECGVIGCILFLAFNLNIIKRLIRRIRIGQDDKKNAIMMLGTMVALFFIYLTAWGYSIYTYFVVLGCIVGYTFSKKLNKTH